MSQNILSKLCIGIVVLLSAIGAFAKDHKPLPFSADYKLTNTGGQEILHGKMYMAWPKFRQDMNDVKHVVIDSVIIDFAAQRAITILPQYQTYSDINLDQQNQAKKSDPPIGPTFDAFKPCAGHDNWSCKKVARQTIAGRRCNVWKVVSDKMGPITTWIDTKLGFPIKTKSADGYILEYTNIHQGPQPRSLFDVPHGYRKVAAPAKTSSD